MKNLMIGGFLALALTLGACSSDQKPEAAEDQEVAVEQTTAENGAGETAPKAKPAFNHEDASVIRVAVPTMQCGSCAKAITEACEGVEGVEQVDVSVDDKMAFVKVMDNTPAMKSQVEMAISKSGYSTEMMERDPAAYDKLPDCCKEGGMAEE